MSRRELILAIDIGTSSARAALFDLRGRLLPGSLARAEHRPDTDRSGKSELDPRSLLRSVRSCIRDATGDRGAEILAAGTSCFWHSLIGTDPRGNPLTPIYTWADSRCRGEAERLRDELDERQTHARTGCMLRASFWPAKLRWLRRVDPDLSDRVAFWMSPAEWLQWQIAGRATCSASMASGTGLYDPSKQTWDPALLAACGLDESRLLPLDDHPAPWEGAEFFPGIGDGAASNLGSGATGPDSGAINVGTSAALRVVRTGRKAKAPFGLFCYRIDAERHLIGGAVSNAGNLFAWCRSELNLPADPAEIERRLASRPLPEHGLGVLPFWTAERAPSWDENASGTITGITSSTTALDLLQAINEAFYLRLALIGSMVRGNSRSAIHWNVSGGILNSPSALQRLANIMGQPLHPNTEPEASLRGAAVFALEKLGLPVPPLAQGKCVDPDPAAAAAYRIEAERQASLEDALAAKTR